MRFTTRIGPRMTSPTPQRRMAAVAAFFAQLMVLATAAVELTTAHGGRRRGSGDSRSRGSRSSAEPPSQRPPRELVVDQPQQQQYAVVVSITSELFDANAVYMAGSAEKKELFLHHPTSKSSCKSCSRLRRERKRLRLERQRRRKERQRQKAKAERQRRRREERERRQKEKEEQEQEQEQEQNKQPQRPDVEEEVEYISYEDTVEDFKTIEVAFKGLCADFDEDGSLSPESKAALESALLDYSNDEARCDANTNEKFNAMTIVDVVKGGDCGGGEDDDTTRRKLQTSSAKSVKRRRKVKKVTANRKGECRKCAVPKKSIDLDQLVPDRRLKRRSLPPTPLPFEAGPGPSSSSGGLFPVSFRARRNLQCNANLIRSLEEKNFKDVDDAGVTAVDSKDCSLASPDCTASNPDGDFACCGAPGCECRYASESLCASARCHLEDGVCCALDDVKGGYLYNKCAASCGCRSQPYTTPNVDGSSTFEVTLGAAVGGFCSDMPDGTLSPAQTVNLTNILLYHANAKVAETACEEEGIRYTNVRVIDFAEEERCVNPSIPFDGLGSYVLFDAGGVCGPTLCGGSQFP